MAHPILQYPSSLGSAFGKTTISNGGSGYTAGATSIVVAAGSVFPSTGLFWVGVGNSDPPVFTKRCTAISGNTLTVDAAASDGTTDTSEPDGTTVQWTLTPAALDQLQADQYREMTVADFDALTASEYRDGHTIRLKNGLYTVTRQGGAWSYYYGSNLVSRPPFADWTFDNVSTATADHSHAYLYLAKPGGSTITLYKRSTPAAPWTLYVLLHALVRGGTSQPVGVALRNSADDKRYHFFLYKPASGAGMVDVFVQTYTGTSFGATKAGPLQFTTGPDVWLKIVDNNTNLIFSTGHDKNDLHQIFSEARGTWSIPNEFGLLVGLDGYATAYSWEVS